MKKSWIKIIVTILTINALTGCMKPPTPAELIAQANDKHMVSAIAKYNTGFIKNHDLVVKHVYISGDKGHVDGNFATVEREYKSKYFVLTEPMTQAYIKAAKSRGNIVKLYKNSVSKVLGLNSPRVFSLYDGDRARFDWDPALIEFNKEGEIVSFLIQKHKIGYMSKPMRAYLHDRYSVVVTGQTAKRLIYTIGNDVLENGFIKTL